MSQKVALVLGGGGNRGLAHVGVLEVLEREGIQVDLIVGTSMGGIIGALSGIGLNAREIGFHVKEAMQGTNLLGMQLFSARARQRQIEQRLSRAFNNRSFDDLNFPLALMAVDMISGEEVAIQDGELLPALLATSAIPAVFPPVEIDDMLLADGGVVDSIATHVAYELGADIIIAVDVHPRLHQENPWRGLLLEGIGINLPFNFISGDNNPSMGQAMWRWLKVLAWNNHCARLTNYPPHVLIVPEVHDYTSIDFSDMEGPREAGFKATEAILPKLEGLMVA